MKHLKSALLATVSIVGVSAVVALACGTSMIQKDFGKNGWNFTVGVMSIPDDRRESMKATHRVTVIAVNPRGESVTDGEITLSLMRGMKTVSSGSSTFVAGKPMPCETMNPGMVSPDPGEVNSSPATQDPDELMMCKHGEAMRGHYGFNLTIPEPGKYKLELTVKSKEATQKASTTIEVY